MEPIYIVGLSIGIYFLYQESARLLLRSTLEDPEVL